MNKVLTRPVVPDMEISDYLAILQRRKWQVIFPLILVFMPALIAALTLPPVYQSKATILVEGQGLPQEFVETTITGFVQERVQAITHRLLTENRLRQIIEKFNLYPDERSPEAISGVIERMRKATKVEMLDVQIDNPSARKQSSSAVASISFTVSYESEDPKMASEIANELANLFLEENQKVRTQQAAEATKFLQQEAERYHKQIAETEKKLAVFKETNYAQLPELADYNLNFVNQINIDIDRIEQRIRDLEGQVASKQSQLSMTEPSLPTISSLGNKPLLSSAQQLKALQAEYLQSREKYSPEHPDIKRLKSQIAALEQAVKNNPTETSFAPDNPAYISLRAQLESTRADLSSARQEKLILKQKVAEYEARLLKTPAVERDYLNLSRDYNVALKNYQDIQDKIQKAALAEQLEEEAKGENFTLIEPASLPSDPIKPNRPAIAFLGFILAFGSGIGLASVTERFDQTVRGVRGVTAILHAPPLAAIPYIQTPADLARKRNRRLATLLSVLIAAVLILIFLHLYWKPIDQWWPSTAEDKNTTAAQTYTHSWIALG